MPEKRCSVAVGSTTDKILALIVLQPRLDDKGFAGSGAESISIALSQEMTEDLIYGIAGG